MQVLTEQSLRDARATDKLRMRVYRRADGFFRVELCLWVPSVDPDYGYDESFWQTLETAEVVATRELAERTAAQFAEKNRLVPAPPWGLPDAR